MNWDKAAFLFQRAATTGCCFGCYFSSAAVLNLPLHTHTHTASALALACSISWQPLSTECVVTHYASISFRVSSPWQFRGIYDTGYFRRRRNQICWHGNVTTCCWRKGLRFLQHTDFNQWKPGIETAKKRSLASTFVMYCPSWTGVCVAQ